MLIGTVGQQQRVPLGDLAAHRVEQCQRQVQPAPDRGAAVGHQPADGVLGLATRARAHLHHARPRLDDRVCQIRLMSARDDREIGAVQNVVERHHRCLPRGQHAALTHRSGTVDDDDFARATVRSGAPGIADPDPHDRVDIGATIGQVFVLVDRGVEQGHGSSFRWQTGLRTRSQISLHQSGRPDGCGSSEHPTRPLRSRPQPTQCPQPSQCPQPARCGPGPP